MGLWLIHRFKTSKSRGFLMSSHPDETILVNSHRVGCNGGGGALGHPLTYYDLGEDGKAVCGYCGRIFVYSPEAHDYADPSPRQEDAH